MKFSALLAAAALAAIAPPAASASTIFYSISGDGHTATFTLPSNPTNFVFSDAGYDFGIEASNSLFDGVANVAGVSFYADPFPDGSPFPGGLTYLDNSSFYQFNWSGPQIYTGPEDAPTLLAFGPTSFIDIGTNKEVTIFALDSSAVPEPATWATMVMGFGLVGTAYRKRRVSASVAVRA